MFLCNYDTTNNRVTPNVLVKTLKVYVCYGNLTTGHRRFVSVHVELLDGSVLGLKLKKQTLTAIILRKTAVRAGCMMLLAQLHLLQKMNSLFLVKCCIK